MNNNSKKTLADKLTAEMNEERGGGGKWPASFNYKIETDCVTLKTNKKINKSVYRCLDSWSIAILHHIKTEYKLNIKNLSFIINKNGKSWEPNAEAFKRRVSYLNINNRDINFNIEYYNNPETLYNEKDLFNRPDNEVIRDFLNRRGDNDSGHLLEKSFQAFLFGKGLGTGVRTNDRMAILGEHFFKLKKKQYGVLREFPTGAFKEAILKKNQITPTEFVDIVTLNREGYLSVIELKLDDPKLEVMAQILDYALYFACYHQKISEVIKSKLKPKKEEIMCYVVNNRYHERFDDVFQYYSTKGKEYGFKIYKVLLGYTKE